MIELAPHMASLMTKPNSLALAREGNAAAFEQLVIDHERMVLRTAWRILGSREDARDAAQEVFLRLYTKIGQLREDTVIEAWLYRVTYNVCQDWRRRGRVVHEPASECQLASEASGPELEQQKQAMLAFISELPDKERAALVLRELEERSTREVAQILGSSEVTVRSQVASARAKLKKWMETWSRR